MLDQSDCGAIFRERPYQLFLVLPFRQSERALCVCEEVIENLDRGVSSQSIDGGSVERAESLMWLWLLGAYEIVRTMHQAKYCFNGRVASDIGNLKDLLAEIRMPAAKMEKLGRKVPVTSTRSPSGWDVQNHDLLLNDPEESEAISARHVLAEFDRVFCSITKADVLSTHEMSYTGGPNKSFKRTPDGAA